MPEEKVEEPSKQQETEDKTAKDDEKQTNEGATDNTENKGEFLVKR